MARRTRHGFVRRRDSWGGTNDGGGIEGLMLVGEERANTRTPPDATRI